MYKKILYSCYYNILQRCNNTNNKRYKNRWWRWIKCEWGSFEEFYKDMWSYYKKWLSIDRKDNDWNYSKDNCRWATYKEQAINRRTTYNSIVFRDVYQRFYLRIKSKIRLILDKKDTIYINWKTYPNKHIASKYIWISRQLLDSRIKNWNYTIYLL